MFTSPRWSDPEPRASGEVGEETDDVLFRHAADISPTIAGARDCISAHASVGPHAPPAAGTLEPTPSAAEITLEYVAYELLPKRLMAQEKMEAVQARVWAAVARAKAKPSVQGFVFEEMVAAEAKAAAKAKNAAAAKAKAEKRAAAAMAGAPRARA